MAISYEEALATLEGMFGDKWSRDDLDTILRNQNGHMENTVDLILGHGDRSPSILIDKLNAGEDPRAPPNIDADAELARQLANNSRPPRVAAADVVTPAAPAAIPASQAGKRGAPTELPPDFLRIPGVTTTSMNQMQSDEALARELQDRMASEAIGRETQRRTTNAGRRPPAQRRAPTQQQQQQQPQFKPPDMDNVMKSLGDLGNKARQGLGDLGNNAKSSFQNLAAKLKGNGGPNQGAAAGANSSTAERRGLLDDGGDTNDEDMALEFATRKDR